MMHAQALEKLVKKPVKDTYGRNLGQVIGFSLDSSGNMKALGLDHLAKNIIISEETGFEKPHLNNFKILERIYPHKKLIYIADNTSKDFLAPNSLNWETICLLNNGENIHQQNFSLDIDYLPKIKVNYLTDINI